MCQRNVVGKWITLTGCKSPAKAGCTDFLGTSKIGAGEGWTLQLVLVGPVNEQVKLTL